MSSSNMRILSAWYGAEHDPSRRTGCLRSVVATFIEQEGGESVLYVPANMNDFFGDPAFGIVKVLDVVVFDDRTLQRVHLRFREHAGGSWSFGADRDPRHECPEEADTAHTTGLVVGVPVRSHVDAVPEDVEDEEEESSEDEEFDDAESAASGADDDDEDWDEWCDAAEPAPAAPAVTAVAAGPAEPHMGVPVAAEHEVEMISVEPPELPIKSADPFDPFARIDAHADDDGSAPLEIVYAWYGVDAGTHTDRGLLCGRPVAAIVQERFVVGDALRVPGNLNAHFGDPLPFVLKVLAVHVRDPRTGADRHLRFHEHSDHQWSFAHGPAECEYAWPERTLRVLDAWYGTPGQPVRTATAGRSATAAAQMFVDGTGTLKLPGALNFVFGDPLPGVPKICYVKVQEPSGEEHELWFTEGRDGAWRADSFEIAERHEGNVQGRPLRVMTGWYGAPNGGKVHAVAKRSVAAYVAANFVEDGRLHVPGNMNAHFGDPAFGVVKTLCLTVRDLIAGKDTELTFREHEGGVWPRREASATKPRRGQVTFLDAWYGHPSDATRRTRAARDDDYASAAELVADQFWRGGVLRVPPNLNARFGDPAFGIQKHLCVTVAIDGGATHELTFAEHQGGCWHPGGSELSSLVSDRQIRGTTTTASPASSAALGGGCCTALRAELAREKRTVAELHETICARDATIAELRRRLGE